jgi:hypothetical protein
MDRPVGREGWWWCGRGEWETGGWKSSCLDVQHQLVSREDARIRIDVTYCHQRHCGQIWNNIVKAYTSNACFLAIILRAKRTE